MDSQNSNKNDRIERLKNLHKLRIESRIQNHHEVVAEDARKKLPKNWESRKRKADWILADEMSRVDAESAGKNYERMKLLEVSAIDADKIATKKRRKNPDHGFSNFESQTARQYASLVRNMPPRDMEKYQQQKLELGEAFYCAPNTILHGLHKDTPDAIQNMVNDLESKIEKRKKFSRRRCHNDDAEIDCINERNLKFNKKLERYYGQYTVDIKENLERGTAL